MVRQQYIHGFDRQRGESLLEALVAVLVFSVGLVGLAAMQINAMRQGQETIEYNAAMQLAAALAEQMRADPAGAELGHFADPTTEHSDPCSPGAECASLQFTRSALAHWRQNLQTRLPGAEARVCRDGSPADGTPTNPACDGAGARVIKLWWPDHSGQLRSYHLQPGIP